MAAQVFVAITERGSLIGAAQALDMSRAMVTRYLAEMETWAGARLLHRSTRRLSLTVAGEGTLERCRQLLDIADKMTSESEDEQASGLIRIACAASLAKSAMLGAVTDYMKRHPRTAIDFLVGGHAVNLVEERIDMAIRITNQLDPNIIARRLGSCVSVTCAAPSYLALHGAPKRIEELAMHNCLTYTYFGKSQWAFTHKGEEVTVPVSGNLSANEALVILEAVKTGVGIALQPLHLVAPLIASGHLVLILPQYRPPDMDIHAIYTSRQHQSVGVRTLLDFLVGWFAAHPDWEQTYAA